MSIIYQSTDSVVVCSKQWFYDIYKSYKPNSENKDMNFMTKLCIEDSYFMKTFKLDTPFLMDGEASKIGKMMELDEFKNEEISVILDKYFKNKKKKRVTSSSLLPITQQELKCLLSTHSQLQNDKIYQQIFDFSPSNKNFENNNFEARLMAEKISLMSQSHYLEVDEANDSNFCTIYRIDSQEFFLPPKCRFINANAFKMDGFLKGKKFGCILLDPPWINKHVRRRKKSRGLNHSYETLSVEQLMELPLLPLLSDDAVVLIWITNSSRINETFVNLLHKWNLEVANTWYWFKVTTGGDLLIHPNTTLSKGKLPYEKLLICRRLNSKREICNLSFASVPSSIHSHKPPLNQIIEKYLKVEADRNCLEVFARNLVPWWTSVGLEVLKFQNVSLFTPPVGE